jgi:hypothetical protein
MVVDGLRGLFMAAIDVTNKGVRDWDRNDWLSLE